MLTKIKQTKKDWALRPYFKTVDQINKLEEKYEVLSDEELRHKTIEFKQLLADGKKLKSIAADAFAVVREASKRVIGLRHYDVQLLGGLVLLDGNVAEMATGEGKTLVASLPSYLVALEEKGVHIITVNDYLAERDKELIGQIHEFLGLTVGLNVSELSTMQKQEAYNCDITYGVGTEFGFDYLRDNTIPSIHQRSQRPYHFAIVDEIDSVLIDEAKTPLIIAGKTEPSERLYTVCSSVIKSLKEHDDYTFDPELKVVNFTEDGLNKCEKVFGVENLFDLDHSSLFHSLLQSLRARVLFMRDVDYIVEKGEIKLVDMNTGRIMEGRSLSDGLHQAIEAKEGLINTDENKTHASITIQNYYRMYPSLSGMTGTAKTDEEELREIYGLDDVIQIPTNKPNKRTDHPDIVYLTQEQKYERMVTEVQARHKTGQPILIGTTSILQSDAVAEALDKVGLNYQLLNAKSVLQEAKLISLAGQENQITIATNMAGRGTDVMLGEGVAELGGLHVIGTERNESKRIDNQLKGRSGRQGDQGSTQFIISLEDYLFVRYAIDELERALPKLKSDKTGLVKSTAVYKLVDSAQLISEGIHYSFRDYNLSLENVINDQRGVIYEFRNKVLEAENPIELFANQTADVPKELIEHFCSIDSLPEEWDLLGLEEVLNSILLSPVSLQDQSFDSVSQIQKIVAEHVLTHAQLLEDFEERMDVQGSIRGIGLVVIDTLWKKHLDTMNQLKQGIGIRQYQQDNPITLFQEEGYTLFKTMYHDLEYEVSMRMKGFIQGIINHEEAHLLETTSN